MKSHVSMIVAAMLCAAAGSLHAADEFTRFENARYIPHPANDGDSFHFATGNTQYLGRLYYADCPETAAESDVDARRVREQTRYFGLDSPQQTTQYGRAARTFTAEQLARPFTVETTFANALGRSAGGRIYVFVTTADGRDLGERLVENGYARAFGVSRRSPSGVSREDVEAHLKDVELAAAMRHAGVWAESDPGRLVAMRAEQREEKRERAVEEEQAARVENGGGFDINHANEKELQAINGIGPVLARRIVEGRPYSAIDDLQKVSGISRPMLEKIRPYLKLNAGFEPAAAN